MFCVYNLHSNNEQEEWGGSHLRDPKGLNSVVELWSVKKILIFTVKSDIQFCGTVKWHGSVKNMAPWSESSW